MGTCRSNAGPELRWQGGAGSEPDASWVLVVDPTYRRPSLGNAVDENLARQLGVGRNAPLPPLSRQAYDALTPAEKERYDASLPELSQEQKDGARLQSVGLQSDQVRLTGQLEGMNPQLTGALD